MISDDDLKEIKTKLKKIFLNAAGDPFKSLEGPKYMSSLEEKYSRSDMEKIYSYIAPNLSQIFSLDDLDMIRQKK